MATANQFRDVMRRAVDGAVRDCPEDLNGRARMFTARLCGLMSAYGEVALERAISRVLGIEVPSPATDVA